MQKSWLTVTLMKILQAGHKYELANFENPASGQTIQFIEKAPTAPGSPTLTTVSDGTTNEEVLKMLIDRMKFLSSKLASRESSIAITKFEEGLHWLQARTAARKAAGVEGTNAPVPSP